MSVGVVLVAAGRGTRLGFQVPKALVEVAGRPLLVHALDRLQAAEVPPPVVVHPPGEREAFARACEGSPVAGLVDGGDARTDSVRAGVAALSDDVDVVAIHDAARPLTPPGVIREVLGAVRAGVVAAAPALPVADTLKRIVDGEVVATVDRTGLVGVQTPQVFPRQVLEAALDLDAPATDDLALVELLVERGTLTGRIVVVAGSPLGHKVTYPQDLELLAVLLEART